MCAGGCGVSDGLNAFDGDTGQQADAESGLSSDVVAECTGQQDPADLIRETLVIEREIADGLEKLLQEVEGAG